MPRPTARVEWSADLNGLDEHDEHDGHEQTSAAAGGQRQTYESVPAMRVASRCDSP